jgi:hypothetical protein
MVVVRQVQATLAAQQAPPEPPPITLPKASPELDVSLVAKVTKHYEKAQATFDVMKRTYAQRLAAIEEGP